MKMSAELSRTLVDARAYADFDRIHAAFTELRNNAPVALAAPEGFEPFWFISKFADVQAVERDQELFHAGDKQTVLTTKAADAAVRQQTGGSPHLFRTLVHMDAPDHANYRAVTQAWFALKSLDRFEKQVRQRAKNTVDRMADMAGECDFADDIALYYPLQVIMEILGLPAEQEGLMLKLTQQLFGSEDADMNMSGRDDMTDVERAEANAAVANEVFAYFNQVIEDRRSNPREDLASVIANGRINGEPLGHTECLAYYVITATAGHDTTSNSISGAMWALCSDPKQFALVRENPDMIPGLVEESIRWEAPVKHFMRTATRDTEIRGQKIAKDDWMMLSFASACRDEQVYDDPFVFDAARKPNRHMALGFGAHVCLGQHLARLEMRALWEELLPRLESVELAGEPKRVASSFVSGLKSLPIRYRFN